MFDINSQFKNPYSMYDPNYIQKIEEENRRLREQNRQMTDPAYSQYLQTPTVEADKLNNFLSFLKDLCGGQWEKSEYGQAFLKKHSPDSEEFKKYKESLKAKSASMQDGF